MTGKLFIFFKYASRTDTYIVTLYVPGKLFLNGLSWPSSLWSAWPDHLWILRRRIFCLYLALWVICRLIVGGGTGGAATGWALGWNSWEIGYRFYSALYWKIPEGKLSPWAAIIRLFLNVKTTMQQKKLMAVRMPMMVRAVTYSV